MTKSKNAILILIMMLCFISLGAQNKISLRFINLGGDGFSIMPGCELLYSRTIFNGGDIRIGYTQASKQTALTDGYFTEEGVQVIRNNFLSETNSSDNPTVFFTKYKSYNLGVSKTINSSVRSDISLYLGARYELLDELHFQSSGSQVDFFSTTSFHQQKLTYEIDLSYNYRISKTVGASASFYYSANLLIFAGTIGASVYF